jgi:hypothetical protein
MCEKRTKEFTANEKNCIIIKTVLENDNPIGEGYLIGKYDRKVG